MPFKDGFEIGLPIGSPESDVDWVALNFDEVQGAASDDQPDDSVAIAFSQLAKALFGAARIIHQRVLNGPLNGISDGPVVSGICMDEVEAGRWRGEDGIEGRSIDPVMAAVV